MNRKYAEPVWVETIDMHLTTSQQRELSAVYIKSALHAFKSLILHVSDVYRSLNGSLKN